MTIRIDSSWGELLPATAPGVERRRRWATWLRLARPLIGRAVRDWAGQQERCCDCRHSRGGWCRIQELPCAVNPYLTIRHGIPGMACMGMGFEPRQLSLFGAARSTPATEKGE
ncbi:hypothetical protein N5K27_22665 [Pigmentiphaga sp. GD03639]|uniref:hypothetical protein n=1 Tax=Pigmentiphaga sp. GD03639 TaxID=2975354 RepID=UPI00244BC184|nr:hypothetical protein [Pigmentiphaga sp. GD03639]MDH2239116.1 hypothetical protein [Pigmentiphaga sp. GD03639]